MDDSEVQCAKCGAEMFGGAHFCMRCGAQLALASAQPEHQEGETHAEAATDPVEPASAKLRMNTAAKSDVAERLRKAPRSSAPDFALTGTISEAPARSSGLPNLDIDEIDDGFASIQHKEAPPDRATDKDFHTQAEASRRMAEFSKDEVLRRVRLKQSLKRAGLSGIDLSGANLEGADFSRADLDGANLEGAKLRGAIFKNASLREAVLKGADLAQCNLDKADLEGANLQGAHLDGANLNRAALGGAKLEGASLAQASLVGTELTGAHLGRAVLREADLSHAELSEAFLGGAILSAADLTNANLSSSNLEGAALDGALLDDADLSSANLTRANLRGASMERSNFEAANLSGANLFAVDARQANFANAALEGADLGEARLGGAKMTGAKIAGVVAEWVDASIGDEGTKRIARDRVSDFLRGNEVPQQPATRYFGKGDVLRDATLEFGRDSKIHIDSRFENCSIALGEGAELVVGDPGVLKDCQIVGAGNITIHGRFFERQSPGIAGVRSLVVSSRGAMVGAVEQAAESTTFAFQPGCQLRVKILRPREPQAAE